MTDPAQMSEFVDFFKTLADANRLRIVGLLSTQPYTVEQLAAILGLGASTVSHHLSRLADIGLVNARAESYYSIYSLDTNALEEKSRRLLSKENLPRLASDVDQDSFDRKILNNFLGEDGRLKTIPAQRKKQEVVLRYLLTFFEPGKRYAEKEVNEIIARVHDDTASLRRAMIEFRLMKRDQGFYWRIDEGSQPTTG